MPRCPVNSASRTPTARPNPFADDWPWIEAQLQRDPALQATTLFAVLADLHPSRYKPIQLRTLQRHIATWHAQHGPEHEVIFPQVHCPGQVTLAGISFPHLLFHCVLTYSNVEAIHLCFSVNCESLVEGLEACLWFIGGVPEQHRTDHLSAARHPLDAAGRREFTEGYTKLMAHYGMQPATNNVGVAHENGDVEQAHYRFKQAVDQALRMRGSRDFADRASYLRFLHDLVRQCNLIWQKLAGLPVATACRLPWATQECGEP